MNNNDSNSLFHTEGEKKYLNPKAGIAFVVLIIWQFYFSTFIFSVMGIDYANILYFETVITYTMIVLSLILFNPNGLELFRDHFTLWIIAISCFLPLISGGENLIYKGVLVVLGIILTFYIISNRKNIKFPGLRSVLLGLGWSISAVLALSLVYALLDQTFIKPIPSNIVTIIINVFINDLSFTSVPEEACFRGLIFSFLIMNGYKEDKAFIVQAILFWGMHLGAIISSPTLFFIIIPLGTVFMTLIIRKYRMLYFSIMMHTFINVFTTALVAIINRNLF